MPARAHVLEIKRTLAGAEKRFDCTLLAGDGDHAVVMWIAPGPMHVHGIDLPTGTVSFGHFWAGRYWRMSENFSGDLRLSQYTYPDDPRRKSYNRTELTATVGFRNQLYLAAIYSPNTEAVGSSGGYAEGNAWAVEVSGRQPLGERFSLSAGVGHYGLNEIYHDSYNYWNLTLTATLKPFELQLAYLGISENAEDHFSDDSVGDRVALTALWRFSSAN